MTETREVMEADVLFVGGGIASLSGALHLSNLIAAHKQKGEGKKLDQVLIAVLEKGASVGAHGISGAVMAPGPLEELVPDFIEKGAPLEGEVKKESIYFLTEKGKIKAPFTPPPLSNHGNYVVSMSKLNQWIAGLAEKNGVNIFPIQIEKTLMAIPEIGHNYLIEIRKDNYMDRLEVKVEINEEVFHGTLAELETLQDKVAAELRIELGITPSVKMVEPSSLPVSEGKAQRVFDFRNEAQREG